MIGSDGDGGATALKDEEVLRPLQARRGLYHSVPLKLKKLDPPRVRSLRAGRARRLRLPEFETSAWNRHHHSCFSLLVS
jgi:hypothetical protein